MRLRTHHSRLFAWGLLALTFVSSWLGAVLASGLSPWGLTLYLLGFWVSYPALKLSFGTGLIVVLGIGFWLDAATPWALGTQALLGGSGYLGLQWLRHKLREEADLPFMGVALVMNALFVILMGLFMGSGHYQEGAYWKQLGLSLLASELFIFFISPIWLGLIGLLPLGNTTGAVTHES